MPTRKYPKDERLTPDQRALAGELYPYAIALMHTQFRGFARRFREEFEAPAALACCLAAARWTPDGRADPKTFLFHYVRGYCLSYFNRHARRAWTRMKTGAIGVSGGKGKEWDGGPWLDPPAGAAHERDDTLDPYLRFLPPRYRRVLELRYALDMTLEEAGALLGGVSRERVRQLEVKALKKLRAAVERTPNVGRR